MAYVIICNLWEKGTNCFIDIQILNLNAKCHANRDLNQNCVEKREMTQHLEDCLNQQRHFTPFITSSDGTIGDKANALLKRIAVKLSDELDKFYSQVCGWICSQIGIALVRATHCCIRGSHIARDNMSYQHKQKLCE